jgi:hypothetical protein
MKNVVLLALSATLIGVLFGATVVVSQTAASSEARAGAEKALRDTDNEWSKAASANDLDRTLSFYSDDATMLSPNAPLATGKSTGVGRRSKGLFWNPALARYKG